MINYVAEYRAKKGWSQRALAEISNVTQPTVCAIETGARKPTLVTKQKLSDALGIAVQELFPENVLIIPIDDLNAWAERKCDLLAEKNTRKAFAYELIAEFS